MKLMYNTLILKIMFFQSIHQMIAAGTDLSINIKRGDNKLTVAVMPKRANLKDEAQQLMVPLILSGSPEELDAGFMQAIVTPIQNAQGILTNLETFEKQTKQVASQGKSVKSATEKESKEIREKREKMEKLLKKAEEATSGNRYSEAMTWLKQANILATPEKQKEIDAQMEEVRKKVSEGSLFGNETAPLGQQAQNQQQPVQQQQPTNEIKIKPGEQIPMFMEQPEQQHPQPIQQLPPEQQAYNQRQPVQQQQPTNGIKVQPREQTQTFMEQSERQQPQPIWMQQPSSGQYIQNQQQPVQQSRNGINIQPGDQMQMSMEQQPQPIRIQQPPLEQPQWRQPITIPQAGYVPELQQQAYFQWQQQVDNAGINEQYAGQPQMYASHLNGNVPQNDPQINGYGWQQIIPGQPQGTTMQMTPGNNGGREYHSQPQNTEPGNGM